MTSATGALQTEPTPARWLTCLRALHDPSLVADDELGGTRARADTGGRCRGVNGVVVHLPPAEAVPVQVVWE